MGKDTVAPVNVVNVSPEMLRLFQAASFEFAVKYHDDRKIGCINSSHILGNSVYKLPSICLHLSLFPVSRVEKGTNYVTRINLNIYLILMSQFSSVYNVT